MHTLKSLKYYLENEVSMNNLELLFSKNRIKPYKIKIEKDGIHIRVISGNNGIFSGIEIERLIATISTLPDSYVRMHMPINISISLSKFIDKLTYVFLESICYYVITHNKQPVQIFFTVQSDIATKGINSSPLLLLNATKKSSVEKYPLKFRFDIYGNHYRRVVKYKPSIETTNYLGDIYQEIDTFLIRFGIDADCRDEVALVVTELIGNSGEHGEADCLVDIDISPSFRKYDGETLADDNYYYGINIAVVNFSTKLLGDGVDQNVIQKDLEPFQSEKYQKVNEAFLSHRTKFDEYYKYEDFCNITTFQTRVSGRKENALTGGTGLTKLIKSLENRSDNYRCYVISGNRCVNFYKEYLEYTDDGWIGFNKSNNYLDERPDRGVVDICFIYMPGTAYNFNFIMKGEEISDGE